MVCLIECCSLEVSSEKLKVIYFFVFIFLCQNDFEELRILPVWRILLLFAVIYLITELEKENC